MAKTYYADYVNHILRFYFRYDPSKGFKNDVDKANYYAADRVIRHLHSWDRDMLSTIFKYDGDSFSQTVTIVALEYETDVKNLWALISTVTSKIAKERGLL